MFRGLVLRALTLCAALAFTLATLDAARAEAKQLRVAKQFGVAYMQFMVMQDQGMIEKHAKAAGLGDITVDWATFRSSDVMNDALISGSVDFVCLGIPGIITIWSKTRGNIDVKAASGLNVSPLMLLVRDPSIKSLKDFKDHHKIAMPAVKVSMQAIMLQMAAAREFGEAKFNALDHLTVSMAHPDATAAMLGGGASEVVANFSSAPFQYRQMKNPNIRRLLTSTDLFDGGLSFNVIATTSKFRAENPKLHAAFLAALKESTDFINADKKRAAEIYLKVTGDKTPLNDILEVLADPAIQYTTKVSGIESFVSFMAKTGQLRNPPSNWRDMFFPEALAQAGG
jgi:NitT/TauT family transport system substrate-binding protein